MKNKSGPDRVFTPNKAQDAQIGALYFRPEKYTGAYVLQSAATIYKKPVTLNHLNRHYGGRANPKGMDLPKDHGGLIKVLQGS